MSFIAGRWGGSSGSRSRIVRMEIRSGESSGFLVLHAFVDHALDLLIAEILEGLALDAAQESFPDQFQKTLFLSPGGERIALFGADLVDNFRGTAFGEILPVFRGEAFPGTILECDLLLAERRGRGLLHRTERRCGGPCGAALLLEADSVFHIGLFHCFISLKSMPLI